MIQKLRFTETKNSEFYPVLKERVENYFKENNISKNANFTMWSKITFFLGSFVVLYALMISNRFNHFEMLILAILLGMFAAFIGFNVAHDAIHGSLSENPAINKIFSIVFNILGANPYMWSITHNVVHHTYTNIPGHDEDIEVAPGLIRLSPEDKLKPVHKFQHFYAFLLYGFASLSWVFRKDYVKFFQKKIGNYDNSNHPRKEYFNLFFYKGLYYALFIIIPLIVLNVTWWQFLIGFVCMHLAEGVVLGLVFQLAHVVEGTTFPTPNNEGNIVDDWAAHQMKTTANFDSKNPIVNFFCGGLNMQVEHHLFPKICHIHYTNISHIVRETAHEFNLPYIENKTFGSALVSHYKMLKRFGKDDYAIHKKELKLVSSSI